ncbi:MAG: hypothetical protein J5859_06280 [Clostridia bacterium]|nr:hypothetical protein [Clostridia bacterium]
MAPRARRKDDGKEAVGGQAAPYLLLERDVNSRIYQVFAAQDRLCFIFVGSEITGVDPEKICDTLPAPGSASFGDKSFTLEYGQISRLEFKPVRTPFTYIANSGTVNIYSPKKRTYAIVGDMPPEIVIRFFKDLGERVSVDRKKLRRRRRVEELDAKARKWNRERWDPKRYRTLRGVTKALKIVGGLSFFVALILPFYPDVFGVLCFISFSTAFTLAAVWPQYYSMDPDNWGEKGRHIELIGPLSLSGMGMTLHMINLDFIPEYTPYAAGVITGLLLSAVLIWRLREHHGRTGRKLLTYFLLLIFSIGIPAQVNTMLDFSEPVREQVEVVRTYIVGGRYKNYEVKVRTEDGKEYKLEVSESFYRNAAEGMSAGMEVYRGALGMRYIRYIPPAEEGTVEQEDG